MKKVLSFVLVLSMILGSFGMAFAAPADVVGKDYEDAVNVLVELGVVAGYEDGSYRPENIVTRAEMATFIIKALGLADYAVGKSAFTDMAGHWADPFVAYAASLGFVAGNTDGTFKPDATVSYDQAITMLVQALGYKAEYMTGGYPGAFVNQAKTLGMLDGVKSGAAGANRGDVAVLLFNTLNCGFVRYDADGKLDYVALSGDRKDTMMERLGASEYNGGDAFVAGTPGHTTAAKEYFGAYVTAYEDADGEILAIEEVKSVFVKGDLDVDADTFTTVDDVEYNTERLTTGAIAKFVNGVYSTDEALTSAEGITLAVKISGKYFTEVYSSAVWTAKDTIKWTEELAEELAEDDTLDDIAFEMTDNDEIDLDEVVILGVEALEDIEKDNVVTYYTTGTGSNEKVVKVEVGTEVVEGKVTKMNSAQDKATINGKAYDVVSGCAVATGDEGKFFLNYDGDIKFAEATSTALVDYAMITYAMGADPNAAFGETAVTKVKMVTADGKETVFTADKDVVVTGSVVSGEAVAYKLNKDGEVAEITTVDAVEITNGAILTAKGYLDDYKVSDKVVVFQYDGEGSYDVVALSALPTNDAAKIAGNFYVLNDDEEVVVIILGGEVVADADAVYGVMSGYEFALDADEDPIYEVTMLVGDKAPVYATKDRTFVIPATKAALYKVVFDGEALKELQTVTSEGINSGATVAAIKDGNIQLSTSADGKYEDIASDVQVYLVNKDGDMEASSFSKIAKKDVIVEMYELDGEDDKDGIDVIIFDEI